MANYSVKRQGEKLPALPCPECRDKGRTGRVRIGNERTICSTCNNFARNVERRTRKELKDKYLEEYQRIRLKAEYDLYPQVIENWEELKQEREGLVATHE